MARHVRRRLFLAGAFLFAAAFFAAAPSQSHAQWRSYGLQTYGLRGFGYGYGYYPSWGYNVGMPGYYADFRAQSYYAAPWIAGYEAPWYSPAGYGCGGYVPYLGFGYTAGRYPWIWNRNAGFVTRGFATASPPASAKVYKNPFYKPSSEASPSDKPATEEKMTAKPQTKASAVSMRVVSNPFFSR